MGSFNTTCFVSQQTIVPEAEVYIFPIHQQSTYNPIELSLNEETFAQYGYAHTTCYPTAFWGYAGPIIKGVYNDYGSFILNNEKSNEKNIINFFNYLHGNLYKVKAGENKYHDLPLDFQALYSPEKVYTFSDMHEIWDKMWEVSNENRLFLTSYKGNPQQLQFAVMHEKAAIFLINKISKSKDWNNKSCEQKTYFTNYLENKLASTFEMFDKEEEKDAILFFMAHNLSSLRDYKLGEQEGCYIAGHYKLRYEVKEIVNKVIAQNPGKKEFTSEMIDQLFDLFKDNIDHRYIHQGLNALNIKLSPMVYASQDYSNEIGDEFAKMVKEVNNQITSELKENNDEDDNEPED